MKTSTAFSFGLLALATASPVPQDLDFDSYDSIPVSPDVSAPIGAVVPVVVSSYAPSVAASAAVAGATSATDADLQRRGSCKSEPAGNGPLVSPDTDADFLANPAFSAAALSAKAPSPFFLAVGFQNLHASASNPSYQTYISSSLTSYDPAACAAKCESISGCVSFNIYFERDPAISVDKANCPTSDSLTRIKCSFFGTPITTADATNVGQYTGDFHVVIAGSNTYTTAPQPQPGFSGPVSAGNASINAPTASDTYMGVQSFPMTQPFDPSVCAAACTAKSAYNTRHAALGTAPRLCNFFDAYILYKNGQNGVFTCTYYTTSYDVSYATNHGQFRGSDHYTIGSSYLYTADA